MGAGIPGTGMATLFYILSVFVMPLREIVRTVRGQSSWARWKLIARHLVIALAMTAAVYGTFRYLPGVLLPPDTTIGGVSALAVTGVLFVLYLTVVNLLALLIPGKLELPHSKAFPERRSAGRAEGPAPTFRPQRAQTLLGSPTHAVRREDAPPRTSPPVAQLPLSARRPVVAVGVVARDRSRKDERGRTKHLAWAGLSIAVVLSLVLGFVRATEGESLAGGVAAGPTQSAGSTQSADPRQSKDSSGLLTLPATAVTPSEQLSATITALTDLARRDADGVGPEAAAVLESLRRVDFLEGGPQRSAAVVINTSVGAAVAAGGLDAGVGQRVNEVLDGVARPERLIDLVQLVGADPLAIGLAGAGLLDPLIALDHAVPADETAARAAALLQTVIDGAEKGALSEAFRTAAFPKLQELADPAAYSALRDLVADVERDPSRVGPAGQQVLASLQASVELPVFPQGNEVLSLLGLVLQDGQVTPAFRDAAIPVLLPLVR